jgi:hypothetical protein
VSVRECGGAEADAKCRENREDFEGQIQCYRSANAAVTPNLQIVVELIDDQRRARRKQRRNQERKRYESAI